MSYGLEQYGIDPYGSTDSSVAGGLSIVGAKPVSTHTIRVTLAKEPQAISSQLPGDVFNPRTWTVVRLDSGVGFTVMEVVAITSNLEYEIRLLEALGSSNVQHQVSSETLLGEDGGLIENPMFHNFFGLLDASQSTPERRAAQDKYAIRDIFNPQGLLPSGSTGGVYTVATDGDYQLHGGTDFARKMILRRMMTTRGGFSHLPGFGVGLRVKEPLPSGDLISLQKDIEDQVKLEPEVDKVKVSVSQNKNALTIVVLARLKTTGQQISVPVSTPFGANF